MANAKGSVVGLEIAPQSGSMVKSKQKQNTKHKICCKRCQRGGKPQLLLNKLRFKGGTINCYYQFYNNN